MFGRTEQVWMSACLMFSDQSRGKTPSGSKVEWRYVAVTGSHHYAAPEGANMLTLDDRADVWSVGCIGLRMVLTGLRGVDDISSRLDDSKYTPSFLDQLLNLAEEVMVLYYFYRGLVTIKNF